MNLSGAFRDYGNAPRNDSKTNENSENFLPSMKGLPCTQAHRV